MVIRDRNRLIKEIREKVPGVTLQQLGQMFPREDDKKPLTRQRVHQIVTHDVKSDTISNMESSVDTIKIKEPISATQVADLLKIPYSVVSTWVSRGLVKKAPDQPDHAAPGKPVLLDPVTLQERIDRYRPRQKKILTTA